MTTDHNSKFGTRLTAIEGNGQRLDGGAMFGNAPRTVWEKWISPDSLGRIPLACRCLLIEFTGVKVLCEAGIGNFFEPKLAERYGVESPEKNLLLENLQAHGHSPESIDYVILSHLHFDHAGGLLPGFHEMSSGQAGLVFPNAKFIVGETAWSRACHPHLRDRASFMPELNKRLAESGRLIIWPRDPLPEPLADRLELIATDGHTPGQLHTLLSGERGKVFFCGDLIPGTSWVHLPITMGYDRYPEKLIDEKEIILARALAENWLLFYTHDAKIAASYLHRGDGGRFEARQTFARLTDFAL